MTPTLAQLFMEFGHDLDPHGIAEADADALARMVLKMPNTTYHDKVTRMSAWLFGVNQTRNAVVLPRSNEFAQVDE